MQNRTGKYKCRTGQGSTSVVQDRKRQVHDRNGKYKCRIGQGRIST